MDEARTIMAREMRAMRADMLRDTTARFCLGEPGEYFERDEWDRRADLLANPATMGPYLRGEIE
jgi:hypothetical protein